MPANRTNEAMDANARHAANGDQKHNLATRMALDLPRGTISLSDVDSLMVGLQGSSVKALCQSCEASNNFFVRLRARAGSMTPPSRSSQRYI